MMTTLYQLIVAVILGLVQGISEWLPISSKTQVLIVSHYLLGLSASEAYSFGLFMEIGTVLAAVIYFRNEIFSLLKVLVGSRKPQERKLFAYVLVTTIVTGIIGAPIYLLADKIAFGGSLGILMVILGIVLIADALIIRHARASKDKFGKNTRKLENMSIKDYIIVGISQGIAALPGVSRSGITTSTLLLLKVEPDEAFRLSFIIGIFAAIAAFGLTLFASHGNISTALSGIGTIGIIVAILVSTIVSLFLIDFLIKIAGKSKIVYLTAALGVIAIASGALYLILGVAA